MSENNQIQIGVPFGSEWAIDKETGKSVLLQWNGECCGYAFDLPEEAMHKALDLPLSIRETRIKLMRLGNFHDTNVPLQFLLVEMLRQHINNPELMLL